MIEVELDDEAWGAVPDVEDLVHQAAMAALDQPGLITVTLTDDETVADLNQRFAFLCTAALVQTDRSASVPCAALVRAGARS